MDAGQTMAMSSQWSLPYAGATVTMWVIMMVAMMLPSAAKVILIMAALDREQPMLVAARHIGEFVAGYLVVWVVFSLAQLVPAHEPYRSCGHCCSSEQVNKIMAALRKTGHD